MIRSLEHQRLMSEAEKIIALWGKISEEEYHRKLGTLFNIPQCCQDYWINSHNEVTVYTQPILDCPNDYIRCPKCLEEERRS